MCKGEKGERERDENMRQVFNSEIMLNLIIERTDTSKYASAENGP